MTTLTAEQAQQIEEVLVTWFKSFPHQVDCNDNEALATIRAARAQAKCADPVRTKGLGETMAEYLGERLHRDSFVRRAVSLPEPMEYPPVYPDESRQEQSTAYQYRKGWNDCLARCKQSNLSMQEQAEQDLDTCPGCGGVADNGHDREFPPNPYYCTKCSEQAEQEPTVSDGVCGGCAKKAADGWALYCVECWEKAEQPVSQEYQDHLVNQSFDWAAMAAKHQFMEGYRIGLAEMREKCAKACEEIEQDRWNLYKGRPPYTGSESGRADPHEQGVSMGAGECAAAIRARGEK